MKQVTEAIGELDTGTVVFQLFNNSIYCVKDWDSSRLPPKPMDDGRYHIVGELLVENREAQREMFMELKPLLALVDRRNAIMISEVRRSTSRRAAAKTAATAPTDQTLGTSRT
jgi:hypothetical protein